MALLASDGILPNQQSADTRRYAWNQKSASEMDMRLRKATPDDAQPVALLWHELIRTHLDYDPHFEVKADAAGGFADHIRQAAHETTTLLGVAKDNGRLVGFIHASILKRPPCFTVSHQG